LSIALSHADATKKDLINLLPILADIVPSMASRSTTLTGTGIMQNVEQFLMDIFTVSAIIPAFFHSKFEW
jgi:hypothetical protein